MSQLKPHKFLLVASLLLAPALAAADNCDQGNLTGFDSVYCFSKVFIGEDNRLNENYAALRKQLGNGDSATLRNAQRNWIAKRDASCMRGPTTVNVDCALAMARTRADFLSPRLVECTTVGCASSKLGLY